MRFYFLILSVLISSFLFKETVLSADRSSGSNSTRWGITTQKPLEETEDERDQSSEENGELKNSRNDNKHTGSEEEQTNAESGEKDDTGVMIQPKGNESPQNNNFKGKQSGDPVLCRYLQRAHDSLWRYMGLLHPRR